MKLPFKSLTLLTILFLVSSWKLTSHWREYLTLKTTKEIQNSTLIIKQLRNISELTTVIFTSESLIPVQAERTLGNLVLGRTELLYLAHGEVRAGIDLENLQLENIKQTKEGLEIILPPPSILDSKIDVKRSQVQYYHRGFLALGPDIAPKLQTDAERRALERIVKTACQQGILTEANQQTQTIVKELLQSAGYKNIIIKTQRYSSFSCSSY